MRWPYKIGVRLSNINACFSIECVCSFPHTFVQPLSNLRGRVVTYLGSRGSSTYMGKVPDVIGGTFAENRRRAQSVFQESRVQ